MPSPLAVEETGLGTVSPDTSALTNLINQSGLQVSFVGIFALAGKSVLWNIYEKSLQKPILG